ncbi:hypothetical protein ACPB8Q_01675 [Methanocaldococcus indicus]|uniref:hypothetical protein n=1 Tax=Methanocaldococcus indicus TaxID=213231 RepID=UPI003C6D6C57
MNISFEDIFNEVFKHMKYFTPEESDYSKLVEYKDKVKDVINEVVDEVFEDIFRYEETKNIFDINKKDELKEDFEKWIISFFDIHNANELNEFYKNVVKRGIKFVEYEFLPEYLTAILMKIDDMNFERKVLDYIGINKNLKHNTIKLSIKKMNL